MIGGPIGWPIGGVIASDGTVYTADLSVGVTGGVSLVRSTGKLITPSVLAAVTIPPRAITKTIAAACHGAGLVNKAVTVMLAAGSVTATASAIKSTLKDLGTTGITASASLSRSVGKIIAPVVQAAVSIKRDIAKAITGAVTATVIIGRGFFITLLANVGAAARIQWSLIPRRLIAKVIVTFSSYFATGMAMGAHGEPTMTSAAAVGTAEAGKPTAETGTGLGSIEIDAAN